MVGLCLEVGDGRRLRTDQVGAERWLELREWISGRRRRADIVAGIDGCWRLELSWLGALFVRLDKTPRVEMGDRD